MIPKHPEEHPSGCVVYPGSLPRDEGDPPDGTMSQKSWYDHINFALAFLFCLNYNIANQYVQRLLHRKDRGQVWELNKGMGSKSPHLTNTVGIEKQIRWRKPVIGAT